MMLELNTYEVKSWGGRMVTVKAENSAYCLSYYRPDTIQPFNWYPGDEGP